MRTCKTCGGAVFADGEVVGYGGSTCIFSGNHTQRIDMVATDPDTKTSLSNPPKEVSNLKKDIENVFLQYRAELKQGLNELAGHGAPEEQSATQIINLIESVIGEDEVPPIGEQGAFDPKTRTFELITDTPALKYHIQRVMNRNELRADIKSKLIGEG